MIKYSITEISRKLNVSRQTIYNHKEKMLKNNYAEIENNKMYINESGYNYLLRIAEEKNKVVAPGDTMQRESKEEPQENINIEFLKSEIEFIRKAYLEKDRAYNELNQTKLLADAENQKQSNYYIKELENKNNEIAELKAEIIKMQNRTFLERLFNK